MQEIDELVRRMLNAIEWASDDSAAVDERDEPIVISDSERTRIRTLSPTPEEIAQRGEDWDGGGDGLGGTQPPAIGAGKILGRYYPLNPRGRIELHCDNLASFFWHLVLDLLQEHSISNAQITQLAHATAMKTFAHELFHHWSDVMTVVFASRPIRDPLREEALAVAYSRWAIERGLPHLAVKDEWSSGELHPLSKDFLARAYAYSAPGYRDWTAHENLPESAAEHWIHPNALALLSRAGVSDLSSILCKHVGFRTPLDIPRFGALAHVDLV